MDFITVNHNLLFFYLFITLVIYETVNWIRENRKILLNCSVLKTIKQTSDLQKLETVPPKRLREKWLYKSSVVRIKTPQQVTSLKYSYYIYFNEIFLVNHIIDDVYLVEED